MLTKEELPVCPVATTVALIGSKWKLLILRNLHLRPWRFNEFGRYQSEGFDGQPAFHGKRWDCCTDCLRGGAASGGVCTQ